MTKNNEKTFFVVCIKNDGYLASLEVRKIYQALLDASAEKHQCIRVIDESGEDYLYPADYFVPIQIPKPIEKLFAMATKVTR